MKLTMVAIQSVNQMLNLGAVYCHPRFDENKVNYNNLIRHLGNRFILGDDATHMKWGSRFNTTKERERYVSPYEWWGCRFLYHQKDVFQFFLSAEKFELILDHSAVVLTYRDRIIKREKGKTLRNATTDWRRLREKVVNKMNLNVEFKKN